MSTTELVASEGVEKSLKAGVARALRRSDPDFEDAVQDGWVILLRLEEVRSPISMAFHVGRSAGIEVLRKRKRRVPCIGLDQAPSAGSRTPIVAAPFVRERIRKAVRELPPGQRRIFVRTAVLGYSLADVARDSGIHPGSARSQTWKARRQLQSALQALNPARDPYRRSASGRGARTTNGTSSSSVTTA